MRPGDRVGVAVSGGADSVALLRLLLENRASLGVVLSVVHFNHKLRGEESDADEQFVREVAEAHGLEFFCDSADTRAYAAERKCGIEAAARELRYEFFWKVIAEHKLFRIATAHTMDDQAETVLLRFLRGAGTRGLAGIHPVVKHKKSLDSGGQNRPASARDDSGLIIRPLLDFRRAQLRHYLKRMGQEWHEDASNQDLAYARNKLRRELMPKLREFNPAIEQVLSETADIARADEEYWREEVARRSSALAGKELLQLPLALQRRIVREAAERNGVRLEFHHVQEILNVIASMPSRAEKRIELPGDRDVVIGERELRFEPRCRKEQDVQYDFALDVPGKVEVPAAGLVIATRLLQSGEGDLLDPDQAGSLRVRNWRPGDRYHPAHTREPKKVKELLQSRRVPAEARAHWPVVIGVVDRTEKIVWVPGFGIAEALLLVNGRRAGLKLEYWIRE